MVLTEIVLYINDVVGTYSYLSIKTVCWAHELQVPEKTYNIRPWSYQRVVLCSGKTGSNLLLARFCVAFFDKDETCHKIEIQRGNCTKYEVR